MSELIRRWHVEHAQFARLLTLFEGQLDAFRSESDPDFELMSDVVDYLRDFGDAYHHPREDLSFERLLEKDPTARLVVARLLQEHRVIAYAGKELQNRLREIDVGAVVAREIVEGAAATYLIYYRHHILKEESVVLPRIDRLFTESDWSDIGSDFEQIVDPLFGEKFDKRFAGLRKQLSW